MKSRSLAVSAHGGEAVDPADAVKPLHLGGALATREHGLHQRPFGEPVPHQARPAARARRRAAVVEDHEGRVMRGVVQPERRRQLAAGRGRRRGPQGACPAPGDRRGCRSARPSPDSGSCAELPEHEPGARAGRAGTTRLRTRPPDPSAAARPARSSRSRPFRRARPRRPSCTNPWRAGRRASSRSQCSSARPASRGPRRPRRGSVAVASTAARGVRGGQARRVEHVAPARARGPRSRSSSATITATTVGGASATSTSRRMRPRSPSRHGSGAVSLRGRRFAGLSFAPDATQAPR